MRKLLPDWVLHVGLTISEPIQTLGTEQAASAFARMVDAGKKLAAEKVDVLICGGAPVAFEADTGKLVVAAPAAMVWGALRSLQIKDCRAGFGRLMESLRRGSLSAARD